MLSKEEKIGSWILAILWIIFEIGLFALGFLFGFKYVKQKESQIESAKIESTWPAIDPVKYYNDTTWSLTFDPILNGYDSIPLEYPSEAVEVVYIPLKWYDMKSYPSEDELVLLAACMEAECGAEDLQTICYCVDVVLNRVDHPNWPDNIHDVIYQKYQFSVVANGSMKQKWNQVCDDVYLAISMELDHRQNDTIVFFDSIGGIHGNQKTKFKSGNVWFMEGTY